MSKQLFDIFAEIEKATSEMDVARILHQNNNKTLQQFLFHTYHPNIKFFMREFPKAYNPKGTPAALMDVHTPNENLSNMGYTTLDGEFRRMYLFTEGNDFSKKLSREKKEQLLVQFLEGLDPREAEYVIQMFNKKLKVKNLTEELVFRVFPNLLLTK